MKLSSLSSGKQIGIRLDEKVTFLSSFRRARLGSVRLGKVRLGKVIFNNRITYETLFFIFWQTCRNQGL
jgi:hypothetical protein